VLLFVHKGKIRKTHWGKINPLFLKSSLRLVNSKVNAWNRTPHCYEIIGHVAYWSARNVCCYEVLWSAMNVICYKMVCHESALLRTDCCVDVLLTRSVMNVSCCVRVCVERICYKLCRLWTRLLWTSLLWTWFVSSGLLWTGLFWTGTV